jgi:tripeptide aminopeptidase
MHPIARPAALALALAAACAQAQNLKPGPVAPAVDHAVGRLLTAPAVQRVMDGVKADHERSLADLKLLTEIPAPPFKEKARAEAFLARLKALGLTDATIDAEGNVIGIRKGTGNGPKLLVSAHLDTVFPEGTDVEVKVRDGKWYGPASPTIRGAWRSCCHG